MRLGTLFWGILILLLGVLLLLNQTGVIVLTSQFWAIFGALALILLGVLFILAPMLRRKAKSMPVSIPLEAGISAAEIKIRHGAGRLTLGALDQPGLLLAGTCVEGAEQDLRREGSLLKVTLSAPRIVLFPPIVSHEGLTWDLGLARDVPLRLYLETGASETTLGLRALKVEEIKVETGASSTVIEMPENAGFTRARVHCGAASVRVIIPPNVAGRIKVQAGLSGVEIDQRRFVKNGKIYETPGYESAPNRVELDVELGVGSIEVK